MSRPTAEMKKRHLRLTTDLSNHIDRSINEHEYKQFENLLRDELPPMDRKNAKDIMDIFRMLEKRGKLAVGKYDNIKQQLQGFQEEMIEIIEKAEEDLEEMRNKQTKTPTQESSQSVSSSDDVSTTYPQQVQGRATSSQSGIEDTKDVPIKRPRWATSSQSGIEDTKDVPIKRPRFSEDVADVRKSHYPRRKIQRGYMVIINFTEKREGSHIDVIKMSEFFEDIGWFVEKKQDMTYEELQTFLRELQKSFADKRFAEQYYAFCLVLMSHGDEKGIKTEDGKSYPLDDVVKFFKNDRMPEFAGKPKMFLIQACRGSGEQEAVNLPDDDTVNISDYVGKLSIPTDSDILIAYATTPGYRSYRKAFDYTGSWFLNEVLEVFEREHKSEHVEEMLITVKENVAYNPKYCTYNNKDGTPDGTRQMPCSWSTFTKRLYLS